MSHIGIVGGGIIGLSSAYYLHKAGHRVTLFDQAPIADGCSFGNAGMIVPSHIIPLAQPGMIAKGMRWMLKSTSPFLRQTAPECRFTTVGLAILSPFHARTC